jgi:menaquinone-dependent protoporphyrinogen oxidase
MNDRILVTFASRTGSTAGVAETIGKILAEGGTQVDVLPMKEVKDLAPYRAVVAGSAIRGAKWLPEAMHFVQTHQAELASKPFAAFLVCMTLAISDDETYRQHAANMLQPVRALVTPVSEGLFSGVLYLDKVPSLGAKIKFRLSIAMRVWSEGDHRDWEAIRAWAEDLRPRLAQ